jgi:hypothetical protein
MNDLSMNDLSMKDLSMKDLSKILLHSNFWYICF